MRFSIASRWGYVAAAAISLMALAMEGRAAPPSGPAPLHVAGNQLVGPGNASVRLRGVNIPSLEWTAAGEHVDDSLKTALEGWRANIIRLPLCQDRWFGKTPEQTDGGAAYRARFGPDNYSFDVDDVHVIVWDTNLSEDEQLAFVAADVARVPRDMTIVALGHASPTDAVADRLAEHVA